LANTQLVGTEKLAYSLDVAHVEIMSSNYEAGCLHLAHNVSAGASQLSLLLKDELARQRAFQSRPFTRSRHIAADAEHRHPAFLERADCTLAE
jgi:hypothetical protein